MADYTNKNAPVQSNPIGIEAPITSIQLDLLNGLSWLETSYGRAVLMPTEDAQPNAPKRYEPKVYVGNRRYKTVLPNDNLMSQSFMHVLQPEKVVDYQMNSHSQNLESEIALVVWVNLEKIDVSNNEMYLEQLKSDVLRVLYNNSSIVEVNSIIDEDARRIYSPYSIDDLNKELLMYPFKAMRFDFKIAYESFC